MEKQSGAGARTRETVLRHHHRRHVIGLALGLTSIDPIKALYWSAVINGVTSVPIRALMMKMASNPRIMGEFRVQSSLRVAGWAATGVMAVAVSAMFVIFALT